MNASVPAVAALVMQNGFRDPPAWEQLCNFIVMGKCESIPGLDIPAMASLMIVNGFKEAPLLEEVRTYMDGTFKWTAPMPPDGVSGFVYQPPSATGLTDVPLGFTDILGDNTLINYSCGAATESDLIQIWNCFNLQSISCPNISQVPLGIDIRNNFSLSSINIGLSASRLNTEYVVLDKCPFMASLDMSTLADCYAIYISNNMTLASVDFSGLLTTHSGDVSYPPMVFQNNRLLSLSFPNLAITNDRVSVSIFDEPFMATVSFAILTDMADLNITGSGVVSVSFPSLVTSLGHTYDANYSLTTLSFPLLTDVYFGSISISRCDAMVITSLPSLTHIHNGALQLVNNQNLSVFSAPNLVQMASLDVHDNPHLLALPILSVTDQIGMSVYNNPSIAHLVCPSTQIIGFNVHDCSSLDYIRFPASSVTRNGFVVYNCSSLNEISLNGTYELNYGGNPSIDAIYLDNLPLLTQVNIPHLGDLRPGHVPLGITGNIHVRRCASLTTMDLGSWIPKFDNLTLDFSFNGFQSAFINDVLARCVASSAFNHGTIDFRLNPFGPTGQGVTDKATLIARGINVMTI